MCIQARNLLMATILSCAAVSGSGVAGASQCSKNDNIYGQQQRLVEAELVQHKC